MNFMKRVDKKIYSFLSFGAKKIVNEWLFFKRSPLNFFVLIFSWLALLEITIFLGWSLTQISRVSEKEIATEDFEGNALGVHVRVPKYVGQGEQGTISVSVENFDKRTLENISIYISDDKGEHIWFPYGNEIKFENLKQDEQQYSQLSFVIDDPMPKGINSFRLSIVVSYLFSIEEKDKIQETATLPLTRVKFTNAPELQIDNFKGGLLTLNDGFEKSAQGLSSIKDLIGFFATIFAGIVALRGNFLEIFGGKKS